MNPHLNTTSDLRSLRSFLPKLLTLCIPIILQTLVTNSLNLVDVMMIGQLGEKAISAVGFSNQIYFLFSIFAMGIGTGVSIFASQYWGSQNVAGIHKFIGIGLLLAVSLSLIFVILNVLFPELSLGFFTNDQAVVTMGSGYLRITGLAYPIISVSIVSFAVLRSTENVRLPFITSLIALSLNTLLNFLFIQGNWGFPALGVEGAAWATLASRVVEFMIIVTVPYLRKHAIAARLNQLFSFSKAHLISFLKIGIPALMGSVLWALGITFYNSVYGHIGTDSASAVQISVTIESIAFAFFNGIVVASSIMIGNALGRNDSEVVYLLGKRFLVMNFFLSLVFGVLIYVCGVNLLFIYNISAASKENTEIILMVLASIFWIKVLNMSLTMGILRAAGDTQFTFINSSLAMWIFGVPSALIAAYYFNLPVYFVILCVSSEELFKVVNGLIRFRSRKWIKSLIVEKTEPIAS